MTFLEHLKKELLPSIGQRMVRSAMLNFKEEGRPQKWKKSRRAESETKGKTLSLTGTLRNSIHYKIDNLSVIVGTNVIYAAIHQFGGNINKTVTVKKHDRTIKRAFGKVLNHIKTISVKSHKRKMQLTVPKRPFLLMQKDDKAYIANKIKEIWSNYVAEHKN